jgi:hypothetical protein
VGVLGMPEHPRNLGVRKSLISTYQSLAITTNTPGFEKLNTALSIWEEIIVEKKIKI